VTDLLAAVAELQADPPKISKRARGQVGTREYKYATLDAIWAALEPWRHRHGIVWVCCPSKIDGFPVLAYRLIHVKTGDEITGHYPLTDAHGQALGADITYARRYALCAVLGLLADEDTDGRPIEPRQRTRTRTTGPDHEQLRNGTVEPTPEDRPAERGPTTADPWRDQPPGQLTQPPRKASKGQHGYIAQMFRDRGITDDDVRHGMLSQMLGREIKSQADLTMRDANVVIRQLQGGTDDS